MPITKFYIFFCSLSFLIFSCRNSEMRGIPNKNYGALKSTYKLYVTSEKKFSLDSTTAPQVNYSQVITGKSGIAYYTILNTFNKSIYFYNYNNLKFEKKISFDKLQQNTHLTAYHIKNLDSIYLFNESGLEILLADSNAHVREKASLIANSNIRKDPWPLKYPQYNTQSTIPFLETDKELLFTGEFIGQIPNDIIKNFKFISRINYADNTVKYSNGYPVELYGNNMAWHNIPFTEVYLDINPDQRKLIFSFPVSHNLYVSSISSDNYETFYGGSNVAGTISPLNIKRADITDEIFLKHIGKTDFYGPIKYDKYRKVYYRFLYMHLPNETGNITVKTQWKKKPVNVIILDEHFNYLGESNIGVINDWNLKNVFVTKAGLNIECLDKDKSEAYLKLKIFSLAKI